MVRSEMALSSGRGPVFATLYSFGAKKALHCITASEHCHILV